MVLGTEGVGRPAFFTCSFGCTALGAPKALRTNLGACLVSRCLVSLPVPGPVTRFLTASGLCPWVSCVHFDLSVSFLSPYFCMKIKPSIHSFIPSTNLMCRVLLPSYPAFWLLPTAFPSSVGVQKELAESRSAMSACLCGGRASHSSFCKICLLGNPDTDILITNELHFTASSETRVSQCFPDGDTDTSLSSSSSWAGPRSQCLLGMKGIEDTSADLVLAAP